MHVLVDRLVVVGHRRLRAEGGTSGGSSAWGTMPAGQVEACSRCSVASYHPYPGCILRSHCSVTSNHDGACLVATAHCTPPATAGSPDSRQPRPPPRTHLRLRAYEEVVVHAGVPHIVHRGCKDDSKLLQVAELSGKAVGRQHGAQRLRAWGAATARHSGRAKLCDSSTQGMRAGRCGAPPPTAAATRRPQLTARRTHPCSCCATSPPALHLLHACCCGKGCRSGMHPPHPPESCRPRGR